VYVTYTLKVSMTDLPNARIVATIQKRIVRGKQKAASYRFDGKKSLRGNA
jgi:hypothetical protein